MTAETAEGTVTLIHGNVRHIVMNEVESATGTGGTVIGMVATPFEVGGRLHRCLGGAGRL